MIVYRVAIVLLLSTAPWAMPLDVNVRTWIPADVQHIVSVDYAALRTIQEGQALKPLILQDVDEFEGVLKDVGIDPGEDVKELTLIFYHSGKSMAVAHGQFAKELAMGRMGMKKQVPQKDHSVDLYAAAKGMLIAFLDDSTIVIGKKAALREAFEAHDGQIPTLESNSEMANVVADVDAAPIWGVLDAEETENLFLSVMGDAARSIDHDVVRKMLQASRFSINFANGVDFDLSFLCYESTAADTFTALLNAAVIDRQVYGTPTEKMVFDGVTFGSGDSNARLHVHVDEHHFRSLVGALRRKDSPGVE